MATLELPVANVENRTDGEATYAEASPRHWRWTRKNYYLAAEAGIFAPGERVELITGEVYRKVRPQSHPHAYAVGRSADLMRAIFSKGFHVREEKPIVLSDDTESEPDVTVVRGALRDTPNHPTPDTIVLLIEVSLSTLQFDRTVKARTYAEAGIPEYWTFNLRGCCLEVRRDPGLLDDGTFGYRTLQIVAEDGEIAPLAAPDTPLRVADVLPSAIRPEDR